MAHPDRHEIKHLQVLIAGAGTLGENELYGRALLADARLIGRFVGPDAMALTFKEPGGSFGLFAYAFLASPTGISAIRSTSYGTKILRFREDLFGSLPIPRADDETVERVASLIRCCTDQREVYLRELQAARRVLEDLPEMQEAHAMCAERSAKFTLWDGSLDTLGARSYVLSAAAARLLKRKWGATLGDILESDGLFTGPRFSRIACSPPHGIELMGQRDMFLVRSFPQRVVPPPGRDVDMLKVRSGTLLVGAVGQIAEGTLLGRVFLAGDDTTGLAFSQNILRILPKQGCELLAYAFLSTTVGYRLLQGTAVGSAYLAINSRLVPHLPFPQISRQFVANIEAHLQRALVSRARSAAAESAAIRIIEEEVLPAWLA
jgi:type I restriction enzyme S subunit